MKRWPAKPLGDLLVTLETGSRPKGGVGELADGIPSLGGEHINREGGFDWNTPKHVTRDFYTRMKRGRIQRGDILVVKDGATTGKTSVVRENFPFREAAINEHVFLLRTDNSKALPEFVGYFLFGPVGQQQILSNFRGAAIGGIPQDFVRNVHVPLPPLAEQERIVKLLDEAVELRKLRAQADNRTTTLIPALFQEMFGDGPAKTKRWPSAPLDEIVDFGSGGTPSKGNPEFWSGSTPWVSPKDMKPEEIIDTEDYVSDSAFEKTSLQLIPQDTVLIVVRGMILAHTVPIRICRLPVAINQDMKALLPKQSIEPEFLRWSLQAQHAHLLSQVSTAGHGTKKLDTERLKAVMISTPPLPLQNEFARRVAKIRELESQQTRSRNRLEDLFGSLLHRAFNGES